MRKSTPTAACHGNKLKADSYKEAWKRIQLAIRDQYYLEAAVIEESIMNDRLLSYLHGAHQLPLTTKKSGFHTFSFLINELKNHHQIIRLSDGSDLIDKLDKWRMERNRVVHSLVKSAPGCPTTPVDSFVMDARRCAEDGVELAKLVSNWQRNGQRKFNAPSTTSA